MYGFLHALSTIFLALRSLRGLPGEQNVLIFTCFEQRFPIFEVTPRTARSAGHAGAPRVNMGKYLETAARANVSFSSAGQLGPTFHGTQGSGTIQN